MEEHLSNKIKGLYRFGSFIANANERTLHKDGRLVPLTRKVFDLLLVLIASTGSLQTRESLMEALWPHRIVGEQSLATKMYALRKALGDNGKEPQYIETVRGIGYRFIAEVEECAADTPTGKADSPSGVNPLTRRKTALVAIVFFLLVTAGALTWKLIVAQRHTTGLSPQPRSIAVLPFENLSADSTNSYFVSGIQDEILTRIAAISGLKVVARTSTAQYTSHPEDLPRIAKQLGVSAVLEGSVQKVGDKVLVNVQLINARTLAHIWAHSYTRELRDIFGVEGEIAQEIAGALRTRLIPEESTRLARPPTSDARAYLLFLKGNYLANRLFRREDSTDPTITERLAVDYYHRALKLDPNFALAYARLSLLESRSYWFATNFDSYQKARISESEGAARKAMQLDPDLPEAHLALGYALYYGQRNYAAALKEFNTASERLPNNAGAIAAIGYIHRRQGEWGKALRELREAALLDPRNPHRLKEVAITLTVLRRYDQAEQTYAQTLALEPHDYHALVRLAEIKLLTGKPKDALRVLDKIPEQARLGGLVSAFRFRAYMYQRQPDKALATLKGSPVWQFGRMYYKLPSDLLRAEAWVLKGSWNKSRHYYSLAFKRLETRLGTWPNDATLWASVGIAQAGLGNHAQAVEAGIRATSILPVGRDAFYGPVYLYDLARIYAAGGDTGRAVSLLDRLLSMPAGECMSAASLQLDPVWDSIRDDSSFQALVRELKWTPDSGQ